MDRNIKPNLIGISGKIGSGKDTVGLILQCLYYLKITSITNLTVTELLEDKNLNLNLSGIEIKKLADKLKDIVCLLIGCTREDLEDRDFKEKELGEEWAKPLTEEWRAIKDYEGLYEISNFGRVKSLNRISFSGKTILESLRILSPSSVGYLCVTLNKNGKKKTKFPHQLVAESFLGHISNNYTAVVNHIDENKHNNRLDNIEVVSSRYNTQYSKKTEGISFRKEGYEVYIRIEGKKTYLGRFKSKEEALLIRNSKLKETDTFIPLKYEAKKWTPRELLQILGTQIGREIIHPNIWVNSLFADYIEDKGYIYPMKVVSDSVLGLEAKVLVEPKPYNNGFPNWIITDVRFENEAEAIKERGGILIRINRFTDPQTDAQNGISLSDIITNVKTKEHPSETGLDNYQDWDFVIDNNRTIEDLIKKINKLNIV